VNRIPKRHTGNKAGFSQPERTVEWKKDAPRLTSPFGLGCDFVIRHLVFVIALIRHSDFVFFSRSFGNSSLVSTQAGRSQVRNVKQLAALPLFNAKGAPVTDSLGQRPRFW
jgi:hypothetical protein